MKTLSYHGHRSFKYATLINSGFKNVLLIVASHGVVFVVFYRLIFDQGVCLRVRKFLWLSISLGSFLDFRRSSLSFLPQSTPLGFKWKGPRCMHMKHVKRKRVS